MSAFGKSGNGLQVIIWAVSRAAIDTTANDDQSSHVISEAIEIRALGAMDDEVMSLVVDAERESYRFMRRLYDEWTSGQNRFQGAGELLVGAFVDEKLVAVGGLNEDPYAALKRIGRVRHLYVAVSARRLGIGARVVDHIIREAAQTFSVVRLRATDAAAAAFYERLGFEPVSEENATHLIRIAATGGEEAAHTR